MALTIDRALESWYRRKGLPCQINIGAEGHLSSFSICRGLIEPREELCLIHKNHGVLALAYRNFGLRLSIAESNCRRPGFAFVGLCRDCHINCR